MKEEQTPLNPTAQETTAAPAQTGEENTPAPRPEQDLFRYDNISLPQDMAWGTEALEKFTALAQELRLSPEQAQKLVDLEVSYARSMRETEEKNRTEQLRAWAEQTHARYGADYEREISRAVAAADAFGGEELRTLLKETGLGNHPVIIRTFNEIGKRISEDNTPLGKPAAIGDKTFAEALYGKH